MDKSAAPTLKGGGSDLLPRLDFSGDQSLIAQIAGFYRDRIRRGLIPAGKRLPTCLELGRSFGLAPQTVDRAFDLLARERLVNRRRSRGTVVGEPPSGPLGAAAPLRRRAAAPPVSMVVRRTTNNQDPSRLLFNDYLNGLIEGFEAWKSRFEIAYLRPDQSDVELVRALVEMRQTRGFINLGLDAEATEYLVKSKVPMVILNADLSGRGVSSVIADHVHGYCEAWKHAAELGHRRAAFFGTDDRIFAARTRECQAGRKLAGASCRFGKAVRVPSDADVGVMWNALVAAFGPRTRRAAWPTLIFAQNDVLALRLIRALEEHCLEIPRDLSVIGFDDSPIARHFHPALTTLAKPRLKMGLAASQLLLDILARRPGSSDRRQVFPVHLISRETTVRPKKPTKECP
ncbi:MAG: substrate-binding domain-containing protein [Verrucomicrobiae bacterium]|nr:substrate-binding domain-containing protein [Verrucomicrobiae bacterium]